MSLHSLRFPARVRYECTHIYEYSVLYCHSLIPPPISTLQSCIYCAEQKASTIINISNYNMLAGLRYRTTSILSASRHYQCRHFFSFPSAEPTTFSVTQRFDYPPSLIYGVVSDVQHYSDFVPFCEGSTITKTDGDGNPVEAVLKVGWNQFNEEFASKIECVKDKSVVVSTIIT